MFEKMLSGAERVSLWLVWFGGSLIVLSALLVTLEVALRKIFNTSIGGADELSGYAFGVATTLGFAYALFERAHIRVDAAYNLFPKGLQLGASFLGLGLLVGLAIVISLRAFDLVSDTLEFNSRSITPMRTPLALPQIPWLAGWLFFVFSGSLLFLAALSRLLGKDVAGADHLIGVKSIEEQIEDESVD